MQIPLEYLAHSLMQRMRNQGEDISLEAEELINWSLISGGVRGCSSGSIR